MHGGDEFTGQPWRVAEPEEPLQAIVFRGPNAGTVKLLATINLWNDTTGKYVKKEKVVLSDDLQSGSPIIVLDEFLN